MECRRGGFEASGRREGGGGGGVILVACEEFRGTLRIQRMEGMKL